MKYNIITTLQQLEKLDKTLEKASPELYAVDVETNGVQFWRDVVIGISFAYDRGFGFDIPFLRWVPDETSLRVKKIDKKPIEVFEHGHFECLWTGAIYPENVKLGEVKYPEEVLRYLNKWFTAEGVGLVMHNAPFDVLFIEKSLGINLQDQLFCDTILLKHCLDENTPMGLKETALLWSSRLGVPVGEQINQEMIEMGRTIIRNGGIFNKKTKHVWRADLEARSKYAVMDVLHTLGLLEVGLEELATHYEERHFKWFFEDEVMPLCKEVVIPMIRTGVRINVPYFEELEKEARRLLNELEDEILSEIGDLISDFEIGKSIDSVVTPKALVKKLIEREGLTVPVKKNKKTGEEKPSFAKSELKKAYAETGHWLWGWMLGECELPLSEDELRKIKQEIYLEKEGRRYRFNIGSKAHLRWLFCEKLGYDKKALPQTESATKRNPIPSMKAEVLKDFFLADHPKIVKPLLLWNKLQKLYSSYILSALTLRNNDRLHMNWKQWGTAMGRFACGGGFNLQTLPRVEELGNCFKCGSKDVVVAHPAKLIAVMACNECGHVEEGIICSSAIKEGFIAPEGQKIINADFSSLEPRLFCYVSGDPKLKKIFMNGLDFYSALHCDMLDPEGRYSPDPKASNFLKKENPKARNKIKPAALSIPYGSRDAQTAKIMGFKKLDRKTGKETLDVARGKEFRDLYLKTYPDLHKSMTQAIMEACTQGYVETLIGRRRRYIFAPPVYELLCKAGVTIDEFLDAPKKVLETQQVDDEHFTREALKALGDKCGFRLRDKKGVPRTWAFVRSMFKNELNTTLNSKIQGLAAHFANRSMIEIARAYKKQGLNAQIVMQVHDEISSYAPESEAEAAAEITKKCMEHNDFSKLIDIPMIAEPIICDNLKDSK